MRKLLSCFRWNNSQDEVEGNAQGESPGYPLTHARSLGRPWPIRRSPAKAKSARQLEVESIVFSLRELVSRILHDAARNPAYCPANDITRDRQFFHELSLLNRAFYEATRPVLFAELSIQSNRWLAKPTATREAQLSRVQNLVLRPDLTAWIRDCEIRADEEITLAAYPLLQSLPNCEHLQVHLPLGFRPAEPYPFDGLFNRMPKLESALIQAEFYRIEEYVTHRLPDEFLPHFLGQPDHPIALELHNFTWSSVRTYTAQLGDRLTSLGCYFNSAEGPVTAEDWTAFLAPLTALRELSLRQQPGYMFRNIIPALQATSASCPIEELDLPIDEISMWQLYQLLGDDPTFLPHLRHSAAVLRELWRDRNPQAMGNAERMALYGRARQRWARQE